jgi:hypothetical protein
VGRDRVGAVLRGVGDGNVVVGSGSHVDVVDADAGAGDHVEAIEGGEDGPGHGGVDVDDERVGARRRVGECGAVARGRDDHLCVQSVTEQRYVYHRVLGRDYTVHIWRDAIRTYNRPRCSQNTGTSVRELHAKHRSDRYRTIQRPRRPVRGNRR